MRHRPESRWVRPRILGTRRIRSFCPCAGMFGRSLIVRCQLRGHPKGIIRVVDLCHYLNCERFGFRDTPHTRGFYERAAALYYHTRSAPVKRARVRRSTLPRSRRLGRCPFAFLSRTALPSNDPGSVLVNAVTTEASLGSHGATLTAYSARWVRRNPRSARALRRCPRSRLAGPGQAPWRGFENAAPRLVTAALAAGRTRSWNHPSTSTARRWLRSERAGKRSIAWRSVGRFRGC